MLNIEGGLFAIVVGLLAYASSAFVKELGRKREFIEQYLPMVPLVMGLFFGFLFHWILPGNPFTREAIIVGMQQGLVAGALSSKIYEQLKRNQYSAFFKENK